MQHVVVAGVDVGSGGGDCGAEDGPPWTNLLGSKIYRRSQKSYLINNRSLPMQSEAVQSFQARFNDLCP